MLDAYIIQKIKEEREVETARTPIRIEIPHESEPSQGNDMDVEEDEKRDRGVTIIDYSI